MSSNRFVSIFVVASLLIACESSHKQTSQPAIGAGSAAAVEVSSAHVGGQGGDGAGGVHSSVAGAAGAAGGK